MDETKSARFKGAPWFPKEEIHCLIGGAGGIGSWLALLLNRAGFSTVIYDFDTIEEHNIGGQLFPKSSIGQLKTTAIGDVIKNFAESSPILMNERYTDKSMGTSYTFSAFDNMQARKDMFEVWKKEAIAWRQSNSYILTLDTTGPSKLQVIKNVKELLNLGLKEAKNLVDNIPIILTENKLERKPLEEMQRILLEVGATSRIIDPIKPLTDNNTPIFIDGRLTMEQLQIFCVTPDKIEAYEEHLFDDSEVADAPCTLKQTSHSAAMIASYMVAFFTNHYTNNRAGEIERMFPFSWEYFIPINYLEES